MTKYTNKILLMTTSLLLAAATTACSSAEGAAADQGAVAKRVSALTSPVEHAANNPTGALDAATVEELIANYQSRDALVAAGELPGGLGYDFDFAAAPEKCLSGDDSAKTLDLSCLTGAVATGTIRFAIEAVDDNAYTYLVFANVCTAGVCVNGEGAIKETPNGSVVACDLEIDGQGAIVALEYGVVIDALDGLDDDLVWFDEQGDSFVCEDVASYADLDGKISIEGLEGTWSCDFDLLDPSGLGSELPAGTPPEVGTSIAELKESLQGTCVAPEGLSEVTF